MEMSQKFLQEIKHGNSLVGPVSKICLSLQGDAGSIPGQGTKRSHMLDGTANKKYTRTNTRYVPQGRGMQWTQAFWCTRPPPRFTSFLASQTCSAYIACPDIAQSLRRGQRGQQWESNHATVNR